MIELLPGIYAVPVVIALIQLAKLMGFNEKHSPLLAVGLGLAFALGTQFFGSTDIYVSVVTGLLVGLSAVGLYSGVKNENEAFRKL